MSYLYLIRHPHTRQDPSRPPSEWGLSERGQSEIETLLAAPLWEQIAAVYTSAQLKTSAVGRAVQTAYSIPWRAVEALDDAERDRWLPGEAFDMAQHDFFQQPNLPPAPDWEPADEARERFVTAMGEILGQHPPEQSLAVVSHASVLTLYEAHLRDERAAFEDWERVGFAAVLVVDRFDMQPLTPFLDPPYDGLPT